MDKDGNKIFRHYKLNEPSEKQDYHQIIPHS